jgi:hypothetical protein
LTQKRFPGLCTDHFPIHLDCGGLHVAKRYFKFKNMWLKSKDFVDRFSFHFQDSPSYVLACKLKALKADLRAWNEEFGNIRRKKQALMEDLQVLEGLEEERGLYEAELTRKDAAIHDFERTTLLEEVSWR